MKEKIHTIPVNEAFDSGDECPFCYLERETERRAVRYTLGPGASYMEPEVRVETDAAGFCSHHMKQMYDYGNLLGTALILQTHYAGLLKQLDAQLEDFELPEKKSLFRRKKPDPGENSLVQWMQGRQDSCFICSRIEYNLSRYMETFFVLIKEPEFRGKVEGSKGFCMRHFQRLLEEAEAHLPNGQREWFYRTVFTLMRENLIRVKEDLDWFVVKMDYRNADKEWKNSRDAVSRTMQKLQGLDPTVKPYKADIR